MSEITHRLWAELLRHRGPRFQFVNAIKQLYRSWSLKVEEQMSEFESLVEREIPRLRRYARALTRDAERADDLVLEMRELERALECLSEDQRAVILPVGLEGMSYEAAAQILNVPVGTVRSRLSRRRDELRRLLDLPVKAPEARQLAA
jgi:RNA polymerase sigma factor (sigma-70 family)